MDDRKRFVLKSIVDHYIRSGRPLSSQTLLEGYEMDVSSATIRNDMKYLEEEGLIAKEYSSAGRVPTEAGYRFFVDWLIELGEISRDEDVHAIIESYRFRRPELEGILRQTALVLNSLSSYAGFVLSPKLEETQLESILFVKLDPENALVLIVSELGIIEYRVIRSGLSDHELQEIGNLLNSKLRGRRLQDVREDANRYAEEEGWYDPIVRNSFVLLKESLEQRLERRLHVEGLFNLLERLLEDGIELKQAREILGLMGDVHRFSEAFGKLAENETQVRIGSENVYDELKSCSLVYRHYGYSGVLGILGPIRMDYGKAVSVTTYIANRLNAILVLSQREASPAFEEEGVGNE
jgi:heat-inducible transcriptional repressor